MALDRQRRLQPRRQQVGRRNGALGSRRGPHRHLPSLPGAERRRPHGLGRSSPQRSMLPELDSEAERFGIEDPRITRCGDEHLIVYTGYSERRPARLPRVHPRLPDLRAPRRADAARGQGRGPLPAPVRRALGADPPPCRDDAEAYGGHLALLEPRPPALGRPRRPPRRARRSLVGRAQGRPLRAAAPHLRRVAAPLPRRARRPPPARSTGSGSRCSTPSTRTGCWPARASGSSGRTPPTSERATSARSCSPAAGSCSTTATRSGSTTAPPTPRSALRPRAWPRCCAGSRRHSA